MHLLERDGVLRDLRGHLEAAACGRGRLVLIHGEAGVGKTAVIHRLARSAAPDIRVLIGTCDPMGTPRPLGPLADLAPQLGPVLAQAITDARDAREIFGRLLAELDSGDLPTVLVFEDMHWADEASVDLLRYLVRRIEATRVLLVATYRDDEIGDMHPLALMLRELTDCPAAYRCALSPLSLAAVAELAAELAAGRKADVEEVYRVTGGNPFFVTEVLDSGADVVPATVRQAVAARLIRLPEPGRAIAEAASVIGFPAPPALLGEVVRHATAPAASPSDDALEHALAGGLLHLEVHPEAGPLIGFRHELARLAVLETVPAHRRIRLHGRALAALRSDAATSDDLARLAFHAEQAEDEASVLAYAPAAARHAAMLGAHREAAAQYARALRYADALPAGQRAALFEGRARECWLSGLLSDAIGCWRTALALRRATEDPLHEGQDLLRLSRALLPDGRTDEARRLGREALRVLETLGPSRYLAWAYVNLCRLAAYEMDPEAAADHARRAITLGERFGDAAVGLQARFHSAAAHLLCTGDGWKQAEDALHGAVEEGLVEHACLMMVLTSLIAVLHRDPDRARPTVDRALSYSLDHDLRSAHLLVRGIGAFAMLHAGRWEQAVDEAGTVLAHPGLPPVSRILPLTVQGLVRARRGGDGSPLLDEALGLAESGALLLGPVWTARAEAAWLAGDATRVRTETRAGLAAVTGHGDPWLIGALASWNGRGAEASPAPPPAELPAGSPGSSPAEPYALELAGDWRAAAAAWDALGCPYEAALARIEGDGPALRSALTTFESLGAGAAASRARSRLTARDG